jgi:hypothetical protein
MDRGASARQTIPIPVVIISIVVVLALVGFFAWRTISKAGEPERVKVDINKVREDFQKNGMGGH